MMQARRRALLHAASTAGGIAAALLAVAVLRGSAPSFSAPAPPPGYLAARAGGYTLYAPNAAALREGVEEIEFARRSFRRHFGAEPRAVDVILADSPAAFRSLDLPRLRRPGTAFLPFVTRSRVGFASPADALVSLDGGALLEPVNGVLRVVAAGRGGARDAGLRVGDEIAALNGVPGTARDSLDRAFQAIGMGGRVRLDLVRDGRPLQIFYLKGPGVAGAARAHLDAAARFRAESKTLAHEVCHQLVASHVTRSVRRPGGAEGYGHPALPDWVDEMAATLCESTASRDRRRAYLRANLQERIPLADFARMEHPVSAAVRVRAAGSPLPDTFDGSPVIMLRGEAARELLRNMNAPLFYAQALSLGEFILQRGRGAHTLRAITEDLARGRTLDQALLRASGDAPGLPRSVAALEREWVRWLETTDTP